MVPAHSLLLYFTLSHRWINYANSPTISFPGLKWDRKNQLFNARIFNPTINHKMSGNVKPCLWSDISDMMTSGFIVLLSNAFKLHTIIIYNISFVAFWRYNTANLSRLGIQATRLRSREPCKQTYAAKSEYFKKDKMCNSGWSGTEVNQIISPISPIIKL